MSKQLIKNITCNVCQKDYGFKIYSSFNIDKKNIDLDTNPHDDQIFDSIKLCNKCKSIVFLDNDINKLIEQNLDKVNEIINEKSYKDFANAKNVDDISKKYILAGNLLSKLKDYKNAANYYLIAYWFLKKEIKKELMKSKDKNKEYLMPKMTYMFEILNRAIKYLELYIDDVVDIDSALKLIDLKRQNGNFIDAKSYINDLKQIINTYLNDKGIEGSDNLEDDVKKEIKRLNYILKILKFEEELIDEYDKFDHKLAEVDEYGA